MSGSHAPSAVTDLLDPAAYPHPVSQVDLRETHISWILLTGEFAYKIKKPVDLGFADFSTLERRQFFCEEELRLNSRFSEDLYLSVVPIARAHNRLQLGGAGEPVDYAVQMRQFDDGCLLSERLDDDALTAAHIDELAQVVAAAHSEADQAADNSDWGTFANVRDPATENFEILRSLVEDRSDETLIAELADWTQHALHQIEEALLARREDGFVREVHGDLHLGNVVIWRERVTPFDCIEFNAAFRWIDVMSEIAFVVMDLDARKRPDLAARFLNAYLERTGDYLGLQVLTFYLVYRAAVRAKVDAIRLQQSANTEERIHLTAEWRRYLALAQHYTRPRAVSLTITHGLSGSGKTTKSQRIIEQTGAIRLRSDVERKRLFGLDASQSGTAEIDADLYSPAGTAKTYRHLAHLSRTVIEAGFPVLVDATFLKQDQRAMLRALANELDVPFRILACDADENVLRERIRQRSATGNDASDATPEVLMHQLQSREALSADELSFTSFL